MLDGLKKKTQNLTGTMSLNSQISDLEKANAALYSQLGREYFKRWQTQPVPELAQIVAAIEANLNKAAQLNEEIKRLKGVKKCPRCGNDMAYDAIFCPSCGCNAYNGQDVPAAPQPAPMPVQPPAAVPQPAPMPPAAATPDYIPVQQPVADAPSAPPVQAEAPAAEGGGFCTGCGASLPENAVFCTRCGTRAAAPSPAAEPAPVRTSPPAHVPLQEPASVIIPPASSIAPVSGPPAAAAHSCGNCGASLPENAVFCTGCGTRVSALAETPATGRVCPACHAALPAEAGFCTNCGTRL